MNLPNIEFIAYFYISLLISNIQKLFIILDKTILFLIFNRINGFVVVQTEKRNSQCEHGQPMEQTRSLFCTCNSGVTRCQSQHQCHIWRMNLTFCSFHRIEQNICLVGTSINKGCAVYYYSVVMCGLIIIRYL